MAYSLSTAVLVRVLEAMPHCMASRGCASVLENDNASRPTHATPRPSMVLTRTMGVVLRANVLFTGGSAAGITPAYTTEWSVSNMADGSCVTLTGKPPPLAVRLAGALPFRRAQE